MEILILCLVGSIVCGFGLYVVTRETKPTAK